MEEHEEKKNFPLFITRIVLTIVLICLGRFWLNETNFPWWVNLVVMATAYVIIAYDVIFEMFEGLFKRHVFFDESTLMVLASLGAFALRFYGPDHNEYFEGVLVILLFQIGEFFEDMAEEKSRDAITSAIDLRNQEADVECGDSIVKKKPEDLVIGDVILVGVGDKCLCDGEVLDGEGEMDESSLTGEAMPVRKTSGCHVSSGTILSSGSLRVRVEKEYKDSTIAKLLDLVENSASKKSKATRFITKFARVYTPAVFGLAVLVAVLPPLFLGMGDGTVWARWVYVALSFLVVSCPCAIVISVPLAYFAGLGVASQNGAVVKGAGYFDQLNSLSLVAFDKTGTLTEGKFSLVEEKPLGVSVDEFRFGFAVAECRSHHPIAKAIAAYCQAKIDASKCESSEEVAGYGTKVVYDGKTYEAGREPKDSAHSISKDIVGSVTYLAIDGKDCGYVVLRDEAKPNAKKMVDALRRSGIKTLLLSGDKKANVEFAAETLGIDDASYELLPSQKTERLQEEMDKASGTVAYVGDGINDAPSIVLADVGIAMGGLGSDVAVSNADVVLMNDDPSGIVALLEVARKTKHRAIFCVVFALGIKSTIMLLSVIAASMGTWSVPLWVSVFGDSGVAMLCILAALLLQKTRIKALK